MPSAGATEHVESRESVAPRSLVENSAWLLSARVVGVVFGVALSVFAIRQLTVAEWGRYSTIAALVAIFAVFTESGVSSLTVREIAAHPERERPTLVLATSAVVLTGAVSGVLMVAIAAILGYLEWPGLIALGVSVVAVQGLSVPLFAVFNARRVLAYSAAIAGATAPVAAAIGIPLVALGIGPAALLIGTLAGQTVSVAIGQVLVRRKLRLVPRVRFPSRAVLRFIRAAVPIAATGGLTIVYQRLDILMLSKLSTAAEVAVYSVPYAVLQYSWIVPSAVAAAFFPVLTDTLRRDADRARYLFFLVVRLLFFFSVPTAVFLAAGSTPILTTVFGAKYAESGVALAILAFVVVLAAQNYVLWYGILARQLERVVVAIQAVGLGVNALLNVVLIPRFGAEGAAIALVASELLVTTGQTVLLDRRVFAVPWAEVLVRPLLAASAAGVAVIVLFPVSRLVATGGGALTCILVLAITRYVSWDEWAPLRRALRRLVGRDQPASARS